MSTADYITFIGLFVFVLATQLGRRQVRARRLILPVILVAGIGAKYLRNLPSGSMSHLLELGGLLAGLAFGLASIKFMKVQADPTTGKPVTKAGIGYAALWTTALAGRMAFAYGSTHWFTAPLGAFSAQYHMAGATYAAAFVLMVLAMIVVRSVAVAVQAHRLGAPVDWSELTSAGLGGRINQHLLSGTHHH